MVDRESVITHLQIIHTWAVFARKRDLQFFTAKHLEDIAQWTDDALELLKEQTGTGCWEWISEDKCRCSECNNTTHVDECMEEPQYLFCPYCGKKMTWAGRN